MNAFKAATQMIDLTTEAMATAKPSLVAELGLFELNSLKTEHNIAFTLEADELKFIEFWGFLKDSCVDCGHVHDVQLSIFRNLGEGWGLLINGSTEIGDREYISPAAAFRAFEEVYSHHGFHSGCAA